jgi:hypothetical protein
MTAAVELSTLQLGKELGSGGQATVYELVGSSEVVKLYHDHVPRDGARLAELIDWRTGLPDQGRNRLDAATCWPTQVVTEGGNAVGCKMPRLPDSFLVRLSTGLVRPREFQYLSRPADAAKLGIAHPDDAAVMKLCQSYASVLDVLERNGAAFGDISMRNLLWTVEPEPAVRLIDCDGACLTGRSPALTPVVTGGWEDHSQRHSTPDRHSDRYKLALVIGRALFGDPDMRPAPGQPEFDAVAARLGTELVSLFERSMSGPRETRPAPADWIAALDRRGASGLFVGSHDSRQRRRLPRLPRRRSRSRPKIAVSTPVRHPSTGPGRRPTIAVAPARAKHATGHRQGATTRPRIPVGPTPAPRPAVSSALGQPVHPSPHGAQATAPSRLKRAGRRAAIALAVTVVTVACMLAVLTGAARGAPPARATEGPPGARAPCHVRPAADRRVIYVSAVAPKDVGAVPRPTGTRVILDYGAPADVLDLIFGGGAKVDFGEYAEDVFLAFDDSERGSLLSLYARSATRLRSKAGRESLCYVMGPTLWRRTLALSESGTSARESLTIPDDEWRVLRGERWPEIHQKLREGLGPG